MLYQTRKYNNLSDYISNIRNVGIRYVRMDSLDVSMNQGYTNLSAIERHRADLMIIHPIKISNIQQPQIKNILQLCGLIVGEGEEMWQQEDIENLFAILKKSSNDVCPL